uniref:Secreted protein n=1 Tax=Steinernema glaseri TaxID=37863 RepID=A0A1I7YPD7_9BILA
MRHGAMPEERCQTKNGHLEIPSELNFRTAFVVSWLLFACLKELLGVPKQLSLSFVRKWFVFVPRHALEASSARVRRRQTTVWNGFLLFLVYQAAPKKPINSQSIVGQSND